MAFSDAQKVSIRTYLGYPLGYYDLNYQLEGMMDKVGASAVEQARIETILAELVTVDAAIAAAGSSSSSAGGLKKVDEVEWYDVTTETISANVDAMTRGAMLVRRLAQGLGGKHLIRENYFATSIGDAGGEMLLG